MASRGNANDTEIRIAVSAVDDGHHLVALDADEGLADNSTGRLQWILGDNRVDRSIPHDKLGGAQV